MNNFSRLVCIAGSFLTVGIFWRYFVMYPDMDKMLFYTIVGLLIVAIGWLYHLHREDIEEIDRLKLEVIEIGNHLADKPWEVRK